MHLTNVVGRNGKHYYVSSCYTFDNGYETMIFYCDKNGNVTDWNDLYCEHYSDELAMTQRHMEIITTMKEGK